MELEESSQDPPSLEGIAEFAGLQRFLRDALSAPGDCRLQISKQGSDQPALPLSREDAALLLRLVGGQLSKSDGTYSASDRDVTTTEAAAMLGMSRQQLVNVLKQDVLPFHLVGTHRRLRMSDVLAYKTLRSARRRRALGDLTSTSEALGLYDIDVSAKLDAAARR